MERIEKEYSEVVIKEFFSEKNETTSKENGEPEKKIMVTWKNGEMSIE